MPSGCPLAGDLEETNPDAEVRRTPFVSNQVDVPHRAEIRRKREPIEFLVQPRFVILEVLIPVPDPVGHRRTPPFGEIESIDQTASETLRKRSRTSESLNPM